jgi:hypothetical protein
MRERRTTEEKRLPFVGKSKAIPITGLGGL